MDNAVAARRFQQSGELKKVEKLPFDRVKGARSSILIKVNEKSTAGDGRKSNFKST